MPNVLCQPAVLTVKCEHMKLQMIIYVHFRLHDKKVCDFIHSSSFCFGQFSLVAEMLKYNRYIFAYWINISGKLGRRS